MVVDRDQQLREYQIVAREKELKEQIENGNAKLTVRLEGTKADLALEKEREAEKMAAEEKQRLSDQRIVTLEEEKSQIQTQMDEERETMQLAHKEEIALLKEEIREADSVGYKRGIEEMTKQQGGDISEESEEVSVNPFLPTEDGPQLTRAQIILASQAKEISELGIPSTIARVTLILE